MRNYPQTKMIMKVKTTTTIIKVITYIQTLLIKKKRFKDIPIPIINSNSSYYLRILYLSINIMSLVLIIDSHLISRHSLQVCIIITNMYQKDLFLKVLWEDFKINKIIVSSPLC